MNEQHTGEPRAEHPAARGVALLETRHIAVLTAIAIGLTGEAAARRLHISSRTYRRAATEARELLDAATPVHAAALAAAAGALGLDHLRAGTLPRFYPDQIRRYTPREPR